MVVDDISDLSSILTGVSGEYFVAAELSRRGYVASVTLRNTKGIDILVSNEDTTETRSIQVKTNKTSSPTWILSSKAEGITESAHFYVFVNLRGLTERPDYYVVPSAVVAKHVRESHEAWLAKPGRKGQEHRDGSMRKFSDPDGVYLERWDHLGL